MTFEATPASLHHLLFGEGGEEAGCRPAFLVGATELTGYEIRQARTVLKALIDAGYLVSPTSRSPVKLGLPAQVIDRWFPRLYQPAPG